MCGRPRKSAVSLPSRNQGWKLKRMGEAWLRDGMYYLYVGWHLTRTYQMDAGHVAFNKILLILKSRHLDLPKWWNRRDQKGQFVIYHLRCIIWKQLTQPILNQGTPDSLQASRSIPHTCFFRQLQRQICGFEEINIGGQKCGSQGPRRSTGNGNAIHVIALFPQIGDSPCLPLQKTNANINAVRRPFWQMNT